jgi:hypothetical protein
MVQDGGPVGLGGRRDKQIDHAHASVLAVA